MTSSFFKSPLGKILLLFSYAWILFTFIDAYKQMAYPFFEHNEPYQGLQYLAAARLYEGLPLYNDYMKEASFYPYPPLVPLYFAALMKLFSPTLLTLKVASFINGLFILAAIATLVWRWCASLPLCLLAVAIFSSTYTQFDGWWFSTRPDVLATLLTLWGFFFFKKKHYLLTMALVAGATLCKQSYIVFFFLAFLTPSKIKSLSLGLGLIACVWIAFSIGPEHLTKVSSLMGTHPFFPLYTFPLIFDKLILLIWPFVPLSLYALPSLKREDKLFWGISLFIGVISHLKWGGSINGLLPFVAISSALSLFAFSQIISHEPPNKKMASTMALILLSFFLLPLYKIYRYYLITPPLTSHSLVAPYKFMQDNPDKKITFARHEYLSYMAQHRFDHSDLFNEVFQVTRQPLPPFVTEMIKTHYYDAIIGDFFNAELVRLRDIYYQRVEPSPFKNDPLFIKKVDNNASFSLPSKRAP